MNVTSIVRLVQKVTAPLQRRVRLMVARGVLELIDDAKKMQTLQVSIRADELRDDVERFQEYGFTSAPAPGAEALVLMVSGSADHPVVVAVDDRRYRPTGLAEGEVAIYTKDDGVRILCKANGEVHHGTNPTDFVALATNTEDRLAALENFALTHTHAGVLSGGAVSGPATPPPVLNMPPAPVAAQEVKAT